MDPSLEEIFHLQRWSFIPGPPPPATISSEQAIDRFPDPPAGGDLSTESGSFSDRRVRRLPSGQEVPLYRNHPVWIVSGPDTDHASRHLFVDALTGTRIMELIVGWSPDPGRRWGLIDPLEPPDMTANEAIDAACDEVSLPRDEGFPITIEYGGWPRLIANGAQVLDAWKILVDTSNLNGEIGTEGPNRFMPLEAAIVSMVDDKARRRMVMSTIPQEGPDGGWLYPQRS